MRATMGEWLELKLDSALSRNGIVAGTPNAPILFPLLLKNASAIVPTIVWSKVAQPIPVATTEPTNTPRVDNTAVAAQAVTEIPTTLPTVLPTLTPITTDAIGLKPIQPAA